MVMQPLESVKVIREFFILHLSLQDLSLACVSSAVPCILVQLIMHLKLVGAMMEIGM